MNVKKTRVHGIGGRWVLGFLSVAAFVFLTAIAASALIGPPPLLERGVVDVGAEVGRTERDINFNGTVSNAIISPIKLHSTQTALEVRLGYAPTDNVHLHLTLGGSNMNIGRLGLGVGLVPQGILDLKGEAGFLWGLGGDFVVRTISASPDVRIGVSLDYRHSFSDINQGTMEMDEFRAVLKGAYDLDQWTIYGGPMYSNLDGAFHGRTSLGFASQGTFRAADRLGFLAGAEYAFSERMSGRIEAELLSSTGVNLGFVYKLGGPFGRVERPPQAPPAASADADMAPPRVIATAVVDETPPPSRRPPSGPDAVESEVAPVVVGSDRRDEPPVSGPASQAEAMNVDQLIAAGNDLAALGRYDAAIIFYRRAVVANPHEFRAVYNLATSQYLARDYAGARASYTDAVGLRPDDVEAHLFLGFCAYRMNEPATAARSWRRVLELDPENAIALNNLQAIGQ